MADDEEDREIRGEHYSLLIGLKTTVEGLLATHSNNVWSTYGGLNRLCTHVENILEHGLRVTQGDFGSQLDVWPFIRGLRMLNPVLSPAIERINRVSNTEESLSKGQVWIRDSLHEHNLSVQLVILVQNRQHLEQHYYTSFYGESYIHLPFQDASRSTDIDLRFKSHHPHGLLLLAAGTTDYIVLQLVSGIIEVRMDLGSGEAVFHSHPDLRLDDLNWHHVVMKRVNARLSLTVDGLSDRGINTPGSFYELNIIHGIFLGGMSANTDIYFGNFRSFRGCMKDVTFNSHRVLTAAKALTDPLKIYEISWTCDSEFDSRSDQPISFQTDTSFVAFSHFHIRESGTFSCDIKTTTSNGLVLYNSGRTGSKDFIALELLGGKLKLSMEKGNGLESVNSHIPVADGAWHQIDIVISPPMLELRVNGNRSTSRFNLGDNRYLNLAGHLFLGGVAHHARMHAIQKGLKSLTGPQQGRGSMLGCLRNIVINARAFGFREIQVSREIDSSCVWSFPCSSGPCVEGAICKELVNDQFECICDNRTSCFRKSVPNGSSGLDPGPDEIVTVEALKIQEGAVIAITSNNIDVVFDYNAYRIRESSIHFSITIPPKFGHVEIIRTHGRRQNGGSFTWLDIIGNKVTYVHDGSNTISDDLTIEIQIMGSVDELPKNLLQKYAFVLPIIITPHDDPPMFKLAKDNTLTLIENTKVQVTNKIIDVEDPDTNPGNLKITASFQSSVDGYFERSDDVGHRINTFTQQEINDGRIWFVHKGLPTSYIRLQVSDKSGSAYTSDLKIAAEKLRIWIKKNTGLRLPRGSWILLKRDNLTTTTNVHHQSIELRYQVNKLPKEGVIQRKQHSDDQWVTVNTFAQRHIDNDRVRFLYNAEVNPDNIPDTDQFLFSVKSMDAMTPEQTFQLRYDAVEVMLKENNKLVLDKIHHLSLSSAILQATTNTHSIGDDDIMFTLLRPPSYGHFYLLENANPDPLSLVDGQPLSADDSFSQDAINKGKIYFRLKKMSYNKIDDFMDFRLTAPGSIARVSRLMIQFIPEHTDVRFVNNGLQDVIEGGQKLIRKDDLYVEMDKYREFQYTVITPTEHGLLQVIDPRSSAVVNGNISSFDNRDIREGRLIYQHDDSEHDEDGFTFSATPVISDMTSAPMEISEFTEVFEISVLMRNDNEPKRLVDKIFNVVTNQEKVITIRDLAFSDPDINYDPDNLVYTRRGIPNGEILYARNKTQVYQFSQKDIRDGQLIFRHSGPLHARATIWVTDGQFFSTGLFEIQASEPFIKIVHNSGIQVLQSTSIAITAFNLSSETNVNADDSEIRYILLEVPMHGRLLILGEEVTEFTRKDIEEGSVLYRHSGDSDPEDMFKFAVTADKTQAHDTFNIKILLESQLHPPRLVHNGILDLEEGSNAVISQSLLHITHPDTLPSDIKYTVVAGPKYGRLQVFEVAQKPGEQFSFTQEDIDNGRLLYFQTETGHATDQFTFQVTNGFQTLYDLDFVVEIIPFVLPLHVQNITVMEGGRTLITEHHFKVKGRYFIDRSVVYHIVRQPAYCWFEREDEKGISMTSFNSEDVELGLISLVHDNSETTEDTFTIQGKLSNDGRESDLHDLRVSISPVNDQPPRVIVNTGLEIWSGSISLLTAEMLNAEDPDSPPASVRFEVTSPTNGHLAIVNNTFREIGNFTQEHINHNQVVFVHKGDDHGHFSFQASDGVNSDVLRTFQVTAKPLVLTLLTNNMLESYPNTIQPITREHLFASSNDPNQSKPIIYSFETKPKHGRIVTMVQGRPLEVRSFTQSEVNEGKIFYKHSGYLRGWFKKDNFVFEVATLYANILKHEIFDISVSYGNLNKENRDQLILVSGFEVKEGGEVFLTRENLDVTEFIRKLASIGKQVTVDYILNSLPEHGTLVMDGADMVIGSRFDQRDIINEEIKYTHDDSDSKFDSFEFSLDIRTRDQPGVNGEHNPTKLATFFNISILSVNDQPFHLLTKSPSIHVIQGFSANITQNDLKTVDKDTQPEYIVYDIVTGPNNGRVSFRDHLEVPVQSFTQDDINKNRTVFIHDGSRDAGAFYFSVSDGHFKPYYKIMNIRVIPISLQMVTKETVTIVQAESSVYISVDNLDATTNGRRDQIHYNITQDPKHGKLFVGNSEIAQFTQDDIDNRLLLYIQTDMSAGSDIFSFNAYVPDCDARVDEQNIDIVVVPLVKQNMPSFDVPAGNQVAITTLALDASELAALTRSNPSYTVSAGPRYGKIEKLTRGKRDLSSNDRYNTVNAFTHEDVVYSRIFYTARRMVATSKMLDNFTYVLRADNVQPARGVFIINLQAGVTVKSSPGSEQNENVDSEGSKENNTEVSKEKGVVNPSISTDKVVIPVVVSFVVIVITIVLIIVLLRRYHNRQREELVVKQAPRPRPFISGPLQLEQPNVHIEPQQSVSPASDDDHALVTDGKFSNIPVINVMADEQEPVLETKSLKSAPRSPDLSRAEVSSTVPSCKVIPLIENEDHGTKSPVGSEKSSISADLFNFDWTLLDPELLQHCRTTNPVLRKNQYWV